MNASAPTVHVVQHAFSETLGQIEPLLNSLGSDIIYIHPFKGELKDWDPLQADLVILTGGSIGAYDKGDYPFLIDEIALMRIRMLADKPCLGICLGAQIMAAALNAEVYEDMSMAELGWTELHGTQASSNHPVSHFFEPGTRVMSSHRDTFKLPEGAVHLASSAKCPNQAFQWGQNCLGLQFHPECGRDEALSWSVSLTRSLRGTSHGMNLQEFRAGAEKYGPQTTEKLQIFMQQWLTQCGLHET